MLTSPTPSTNRHTAIIDATVIAMIIPEFSSDGSSVVVIRWLAEIMPTFFTYNNRKNIIFKDKVSAAP